MSIASPSLPASSLEWESIHRRVLSLAHAVMNQYATAISSLQTHDGASATQVIAAASDLELQEQNLDASCCEWLLRGPMTDSGDVRRAAAAANIGTELERIGEETKCIAKTAKDVPLANSGLSIYSFATIREITNRTGQLLKDAVKAVEGLDAGLANRLLANDELVDHESEKILRSAIMLMLEDHKTITPALDALDLTTSIERIAGHIQVIARWVLFASEVSPDEAGQFAAMRSGQAGRQFNAASPM